MNYKWIFEFFFLATCEQGEGRGGGPITWNLTKKLYFSNSRVGTFFHLKRTNEGVLEKPFVSIAGVAQWNWLSTYQRLQKNYGLCLILNVSVLTICLLRTRIFSSYSKVCFRYINGLEVMAISACFSTLRTVPTIVIAHTFCASPDTRIS